MLAVRGKGVMKERPREVLREIVMRRRSWIWAGWFLLVVRVWRV